MEGTGTWVSEGRPEDDCDRLVIIRFDTRPMRVAFWDAFDGAWYEGDYWRSEYEIIAWYDGDAAADLGWVNEATVNERR